MNVKKNAVEWSVFAVSCVMIAAVVAILVHDAVTSSSSPPELHVVLGAVDSTDAGFAVPVAVMNRGETTAEQAKIVVTLVEGNTEVESAELTIAFVPGKSRREGWAVFRRDPRCCRIAARAVSFEAP